MPKKVCASFEERFGKKYISVKPIDFQSILEVFSEKLNLKK